MYKWVSRVAMAVAVVLVAVSGAAAQAPESSTGALTLFGNAIGVGMVVIGAAYGIGRLAGAALESMARQPEVAGGIQVAMIIAAALIEGFTFYAIYVCSALTR